MWCTVPYGLPIGHHDESFSWRVTMRHHEQPPPEKPGGHAQQSCHGVAPRARSLMIIIDYYYIEKRCPQFSSRPTVTRMMFNLEKKHHHTDCCLVLSVRDSTASCIIHTTGLGRPVCTILLLLAVLLTVYVYVRCSSVLSVREGLHSTCTSCTTRS